MLISPGEISTGVEQISVQVLVAMSSRSEIAQSEVTKVGEVTNTESVNDDVTLSGVVTLSGDADVTLSSDVTLSGEEICVRVEVICVSEVASMSTSS